MKMKFEIEIEANTEEELYQKFDVVEGLALSTDSRYINLISAMNRQFGVYKNRRNRTKKEREQRMVILGFDSYTDIAK